MSAVITNKIRAEPPPGVKPLGFVRQHPVVTYYVVTLAISWLVELPLVAQVQGWMDLQLPLALHYLASFGPLLAAIMSTVFVIWAVVVVIVYKPAHLAREPKQVL